MRRGGLKKAQVFLIILGFLMTVPPETGGAQSDRLYPLTLMEMQKISARWLDQSGYSVSQSALPDGSVQLSGIRNHEKWRIVLHAHSPLYTSFEAEYFQDGRPNTQRIREFSIFMNDYVAKNGQASDVKQAELPQVMLRIDATVCISAVSGSTPIHFSGFVADARGIILSTAHDLETVKDVVVTLFDGRKLNGRIVKKDTQRDLAIINVESRLSSFLNLKQGRDILKKGKPVYVLACLEGERKILSGFVAGPVKIQDDLFMWQLDLETPRGSSGSPVFDREGRFLGMIKGRYRGNQSIGFVIPHETIVKFLIRE